MSALSADLVSTENNITTVVIPAIMVEISSNVSLPANTRLCHSQLPEKQLNTVRRRYLDRRVVKLCNRIKVIIAKSSNVPEL